MNKVAVFGNAGGGKSTLSKRLAELTNLPWIPLDSIQYKLGGEPVAPVEFQTAHDGLLEQNQWIIDGFGTLTTLWERLETADTLVYLDMPVWRHYWWVTKRFLQGAWLPPAGWPAQSPLLKGTLNSYATVRLCHAKLTPKYRDYVEQAKASKRVYHLRSPRDIIRLYESLATQP